MLFDNHGRPLSYLRLSVTDRCNLRCTYCMPQNQVFLPKNEVLSFEEILRISGLLTGMGISKIRLTGGEPFVRSDVMELVRKLAELPEKPELCITTNGVSTAKYLPELKEKGVKALNLSMDAVDPVVFERITHRRQFSAVWETFQQALALGFHVKVNAVVMGDLNADQLIPLAKLAFEYPVEVRFIEEMPFNGTGLRPEITIWDHSRIKRELESAFGALQKQNRPLGETASVYTATHMVGSIGIIAAFSRTFCGTCNRLRLTATGWLKTCLYDNGVLNVRDLMREGLSDAELIQALENACRNRAKDGFEAEKRRRDIPLHESMSLIGG